MQASLQGKDNAIRQLKKQLSKLQVTSSDTERTIKVRTIDSQLTKVTDPVTNLQAQNDLFRAENDKVKQHYKELYKSIKITRAKHIEQVTKLTAKNVTLKTSLSKAKVQPPVLIRTKHAVDVEPIVPRLRNNRDAYLDYLRHLKESVETIRNIVEEAKVVRPLDRSIASACRYTKHSQELLEKKQVTTTKPFDRQNSNKHKHVVTQKTQKTNVPVPHSTGVTSYPKASGSQPKSNPKTNRISPAKGANKLLVEDLPRTNKSHLRTTNRVDSSSHIKHTKLWLLRVTPKTVPFTLATTRLQMTDTGIFVGYAPSRKGYRIYNKRTRRIMETIHVQFDELTEQMAPMHLSKGPAPNFLTPEQISSGLVPNPVPATPYAPPTNKELEILFQPMFDEYMEPPRAKRPGSPAQALQAPVTSAGTPLSTTIDQDAPSPHISLSSSALQSHSLPSGVIAEPHFKEDHNVAPVNNNPFVNVFAPEPHSKASSSGDIGSTESLYVSQSLHHLNK
nr:integrase, catalytic region, zinc finger, CCHC-type, peptidase aspartic, catalytic [Tanacetum cinerariifolium]